MQLVLNLVLVIASITNIGFDAGQFPLGLLHQGRLPAVFKQLLDQPDQINHRGVKHQAWVSFAFGLELCKEPFSGGVQFRFGQFGRGGDVFFGGLPADGLPALPVGACSPFFGPDGEVD